MARLYIAALVFALILLHVSAISADSMSTSVRHGGDDDDDDGHRPRKPVAKKFVLRCSRESGGPIFKRCTACLRQCRSNFGTRTVVVIKKRGDDDDDDDDDDGDSYRMLIRTGSSDGDGDDDKDDDDDDDDKGGVAKTRVVIKCTSSACRRCNQGCLGKFGKRVLVTGKGPRGSGGDDDDDDDDGDHDDDDSDDSDDEDDDKHDDDDVKDSDDDDDGHY